jgi:hypothetical protein
MANLTIKGKVVEVGQVKSGISVVTNKEWKMQDIVVTEELKEGQQYQDQVVVTIDLTKLDTPSVGSDVTIYCNVRKANKGYFNNIKAWKIEGEQEQAQAAPQPQAQAVKPVEVFNGNGDEDNGELPF